MTLGNQRTKISDIPPDPIPTNELTEQERKYPNYSDEQEATEKEKKPGDQDQKETFDSSLDTIPTAGKSTEERKPLNTSEEQESIEKEKTPGDKGKK